MALWLTPMTSAASRVLYPFSVTSWAASSLNSGLKEGLCFSVIFPPVYEGVILSRDLIRWPNSLCHYSGRLPDLDGYGVEASLVDSSLPIYRDTDMLYQDETLGYWPSFNSISEYSRGAYLTWLASERDNPDVPLGYVFIYF